ncbi:MAG: polysaccharide ABC transporter ATP-binding protein [Bacteroidota bacterium]
MSEVAISVKGVSKKYVIGKQKDGSLRGTLASLFSKRASKTEQFFAVNNVSFDIQKGDAVGIIGKNGAGKSTLLKILSQITKPSAGAIEINGRIASLLEVGTGFHPELTGRENIFLNGTILGMTRKEVTSKFDEIVAFSGIEKFIDTPVKHYSSGMYVRLAFAVAAHLEPEILIIDEVLAVGDAEFQKKCIGKMKDVANAGRTVLFVSHNIAAIKALCNKGILMHQGALPFSGGIDETINEYYKISTNQSNKTDFSKFNNEFIEVLSFQLTPTIGTVLSVESGVDFEISFVNKTLNSTIDTTFELRNIDDVIIFHRGTYIDEENGSKKGVYHVSGKIPAHLLNAGTYYLNILFGQNSTYLLMHCEEIISFDIENSIEDGNYKLLPGVLKPQLLLKSEFINHA